MKRSTLLLAAVAATSLLAACGDSTTPAAAPTTQAGGGTTEAGTDTTQGGTSDVSVDAYCEMIRDYLATGQSLDPLFEAETPDPAAIEDAFRTMSGLTDDLAAAAPADVQADTAIVADGFHQMIEVMDGLDWDLIAISDSDEFLALTSDEVIGAASNRMDQWSADECGIPLDS